ncbi:MAG TPA: hypothetical protein PKX93_06905, partial [bacterium]|nr:hypothetical protein [bacterium]
VEARRRCDSGERRQLCTGGPPNQPSEKNLFVHFTGRSIVMPEVNSPGKGGELGMRVVRILCEKEEVRQRLHLATRKGCFFSHCHHKEEPELPLTRPGDYESRLMTGFKLFEMPEKGYPTD